MADLWNAFSWSEQVALALFLSGVLIGASARALIEIAAEPFDEDALDETDWSRKNAAESVESARRVQRAVASLKGDE